MSPGDEEDPEDHSRTGGSGDRGRGVDPEGRGGAGATEDQGGAEGKEEPDGARATEGRGTVEEWSAEATDGQRQTKAHPEGRGSLAAPVVCWATTHRRELGAIVELLGRQTKSWTQRLEAVTGDPPAMMPMETGRPAVIPLHRWWAE
ncbi:hypothetical protein M9458_030121, partial [Cirrhinus mrigala]